MSKDRDEYSWVLKVFRVALRQTDRDVMGFMAQAGYETPRSRVVGHLCMPTNRRFVPCYRRAFESYFMGFLFTFTSVDKAQARTIAEGVMSVLRTCDIDTYGSVMALLTDAIRSYSDDESEHAIFPLGFEGEFNLLADALEKGELEGPLTSLLERICTELDGSLSDCQILMARIVEAFNEDKALYSELLRGLGRHLAEKVKAA